MHGSATPVADPTLYGFVELQALIASEKDSAVAAARLSWVKSRWRNWPLFVELVDCLTNPARASIKWDP